MSREGIQHFLNPQFPDLVEDPFSVTGNPGLGGTDAYLRISDFEHHRDPPQGGDLELSLEQEAADPISIEEAQQEILAHPSFERLVDLIFQGQMIGEDARRRLHVEEKQGKAMDAVRTARRDLNTGGLPLQSNDQLSSLLDGCCTYMEKFIREANTAAHQASQTYSIFQAQISSILSAEGVHASIQVCQGDEKEMRKKLKRKYADSIQTLSEEFSNRKKKGKLPEDATERLKLWWTEHLVWPYPSEDVKKELEQDTSLSATQINNWFINQRKRHWHKYFKNGRLPQTLNEARQVLEEQGVLK